MSGVRRGNGAGSDADDDVFSDENVDFDDSLLDTPFESDAKKDKPIPVAVLHQQDCVQTENQVKLSIDGPLDFSGRVEIFAADGGYISTEQQCSLCRCGASHHKPFCDDSHKREAFKDPGQLQLQRDFGQALAQADGELSVRISPAGPYILQGPVSIKSADGRQCLNREKIALCRCGASNHKPFCDGSHRGLDLSED